MSPNLTSAVLLLSLEACGPQASWATAPAALASCPGWRARSSGLQLAAAGGAGGGNDDFGGVDPNMDPELAMALRVSMEEERARQETEAAADPAPDAGAAASNVNIDGESPIRVWPLTSLDWPIGAGPELFPYSSRTFVFLLVFALLYSKLTVTKR